MSVFVTVGTTSFDALIEVITSKPVINVSVILEQVFPPFDFYCKLVKLALVEEILKIFFLLCFYKNNTYPKNKA